MGEELAGAPETSDGSRGQATDSGTDQGPIRLGVDLTQTVEGRALQSVYDSQVAAERRRAEEAERREAELTRRLEQLNAQTNAMLNALNSSDPEAAHQLIQQAALAEKEAELAQLRKLNAEREQRDAAEREAREQYDAEREWWYQSAAAMGINPSEPEFQTALNQTLTDHNSQHAFGAIANIVARRSSTQPSTPEPDYVSPPSGGSPRPTLKQADKEAIAGRILELSKNKTQNAAEIARLKAQLGS